jgi:hypothetical protein
MRLAVEFERCTVTCDVDYDYTAGGQQCFEYGQAITPPDPEEIVVNDIKIIELRTTSGIIIPKKWFDKHSDWANLIKDIVTPMLEDYDGPYWSFLCDARKYY